MARLQLAKTSVVASDIGEAPSTDSGNASTPDGGDPYATVDIPATSSSSTVDETIPDQDAGIRGTPAYMSPEQAIGHPAELASDNFSFGLILYEMLAGHRALSDESLVEILSKLSSDDFSQELATQVDEEYRVLLANLLVRDPAKRPLISEVAAELASK